MPDEVIAPEQDWQAVDRQHIWHPYSAIGADTPVYPVVSATGVRLRLRDGRELIDGMASWWCAIHGYNHPVLNAALHHQTAAMAHVMFGGLTHEPAARLARLLVNITPTPLKSVFFTDSGSVAVEAAMKMSVQYWQAQGHSQKCRFLAPCRGYHGDTLHAMSVCDPVTGMHHLFAELVPPQIFIAAPEPRLGEPCTAAHLAELEHALATQADQLAAVILEPIVQGAGGMRFYAVDYLAAVRTLCDQYDVLLIADEIATGFGRTGCLFACEHAAIAPDIMCVGKALTGGYMTLAAVLSTTQVSAIIAAGEPGVLMHGPTFMANPLACAVAAASLELLLASDWPTAIQRIATGLQQGLAPCAGLPGVTDVRVCGAIGVVELDAPVDMAVIQPQFVTQGVWVRPFGRLVYVMPPFVISEADLATLCGAIVTVVRHYTTC